VSEGFAKIHEDMDKLRHDFKEDLDTVKDTIKEVEKSLSSTQEDVEDLKEPVKNVSVANAYSIEEVNKRISDLEKQLKVEAEKNIKTRAVYETRKSTIQQH